MKFSTDAVVAIVLIAAVAAPITNAQNTMVKMCLFYPNPSGHARSDPIINQNCASGHVHTVSLFHVFTQIYYFYLCLLILLTHISFLPVLRSTKLSSKYKLRGYPRYTCSFQFQSMGRKPISLLASYHI